MKKLVWNSECGSTIVGLIKSSGFFKFYKSSSSYDDLCCQLMVFSVKTTVLFIGSDPMCH